MRRLVWLILVVPLAACGGSKPSMTLSVTCAGGPQLFGATSIDVQGDLVDGRPTMTYPDPVSAGKTGSISVQPRTHCNIVPAGGS